MNIEREDIMYMCKNRKCHNEVIQRGDLCMKCSPPEIETCALCNTTEGVWAFGHCSRCWVARNTQISDGNFCGFADCNECKVYPYSCRTCQCDACGDLYSLKEGDSSTGVCYKCCKKPMSYESEHCPGCDEELTVQANGYCASCWIERFGCEDLSPISWKDDEEDYVESVIKIQKWWRNVHRSQKIRCDGCYFNVLNQQGHMGIGGCLYEHDDYEKY